MFRILLLLGSGAGLCCRPDPACVLKSFPNLFTKNPPVTCAVYPAGLLWRVIRPAVLLSGQKRLHRPDCAQSAGLKTADFKRGFLRFYELCYAAEMQ
jgi:hypothetical protein